MDTVDDPMWVIDNRTIQGQSQQVPKIVAPRMRRRIGFAQEELASSTQAFRAPRWTTAALAS
jgi:hypothetical protein